MAESWPTAKRPGRPRDYVRIRWQLPRVCGCRVEPGPSAAGRPVARGGRRREGEAMIPASFEYHVAKDIAHAIQLLASSGGEAKVLAGGQSLIPLMKFRLAQPVALVDINRIAGLGGIRENGELQIGALNREAD